MTNLTNLLRNEYDSSRAKGCTYALKLLTDAADALDSANARIAELEAQIAAKAELATLYAASLRKAEEEVESANRMFVEACSALGLIDEALGIDPDESGGAAPILEAILALKSSRAVDGSEAVVAWLVTGGRTFVDRAFTSKLHAENSVAERNDGAKIIPLVCARETKEKP